MDDGVPVVRCGQLVPGRDPVDRDSAVGEAMQQPSALAMSVERGLQARTALGRKVAGGRQAPALDQVNDLLCVGPNLVFSQRRFIRAQQDRRSPGPSS